MKITVEEKPQHETKKFPKLMINDYGLIIFANKGNREEILTGVVLSSNNYDYPICYERTFNSLDFRDFQGKITIECE